MLHTEPPRVPESPRFPFAQYAEVTHELRQIIANRDNNGRNSYLAFWDGFPHGLSDLTFETHRRVARILGVEYQGRAVGDGQHHHILTRACGDAQWLTPAPLCTEVY